MRKMRKQERKREDGYRLHVREVGGGGSWRVRMTRRNFRLPPLYAYKYREGEREKESRRSMDWRYLSPDFTVTLCGYRQVRTNNGTRVLPDSNLLLSGQCLPSAHTRDRIYTR